MFNGIKTNASRGSCRTKGIKSDWVNVEDFPESSVLSCLLNVNMEGARCSSIGSYFHKVGITMKKDYLSWMAFRPPPEWLPGGGGSMHQKWKPIPPSLKAKFHFGKGLEGHILAMNETSYSS